MDESGCDGKQAKDHQEPIFVLGGITVSDERWFKTNKDFNDLLEELLPQGVPDNFELHANQLLSPDGEGYFEGWSRETRNKFATDVLDLISDLNHDCHIAIVPKKGLSEGSSPYILGLDYLTGYLEKYIRDRKGSTARGMVILDQKKDLEHEIHDLLREKRFGTKNARLKRLVEFGYHVDSRRNPMVQISDLIVYISRKCAELAMGHRDDWPEEAKSFYAKSFQKIYTRLAWKKFPEIQEKHCTTDYTNLFVKPQTVSDKTKKHIAVETIYSESEQEITGVRSIANKLSNPAKIDKVG
ncbi:MAG: DUF3800 domain-containing protein [Myxococcales bacterium]|nr:MAG: DUF3800 domain-containing protein [Myxococcales bacterium]